MPDLILVLGGTAEARELAVRVPVLTSLAGRVSAPLLPAGDVRIGGFGGVPGLERFLRSEGVRAVIDATHPFAAQVSAHAVAACASVGVPLLRLQRPGWVEQPGDRWTRVPSLGAAAAEVALRAEALLRTPAPLPGTSARLPSDPGGRRADVAGGGGVLLTTGRQELRPFLDLPCRVVVRAVERPAVVPAHWTVVLGRPPWSLESERALLAAERIGLVVTKDSGGAASAKLQACREAGVEVVVVDRPPVLAAEVVDDVDGCVAWLAGRRLISAGEGSGPGSA